MLWIWQLATAASSALVLLLSGLCLYQHRQLQHRPTSVSSKPSSNAVTSTAAALAALERACLANDTAGIRQGLLAWANARWPHAGIHATSDIACLLSDEVLREWLNALDAQLYAGKQETRDWREFYRRVASHNGPATAADKPALEPLYPT